MRFHISGHDFNRADVAAVLLLCALSNQEPSILIVSPIKAALATLSPRWPSGLADALSRTTV
jgi:hypothetical protein